MSTWEQWIAYRLSIKKPKNAPALFNRQLKYLDRFDALTAEEMLEQSMRNGWQGIFEVKGNQYGQNTINHRVSANGDKELYPGAERKNGF